MSETTWMTRKEAAEYMGCSLRHLNDIPVPRSYGLGPRMPRFSKEMLDAYLESNVERPVAGHKKGGPGRPPLKLRHSIPTDGEEIIRQQKLHLLKLQRRKKPKTH